MPGGYEIRRTVQARRRMRWAASSHRSAVARRLANQRHDQGRGRCAADRRKVVVSTNVAETSLTIDGVRIHVIDSGVEPIRGTTPYRGINPLLVEKDQPRQLYGGPTGGRRSRSPRPGVCLRLWTEHEHEQRPAQELPEVKRLDLSEVVLTLKASGVSDVHSFRWLEAPSRQSLERAEVLLKDLGALESPSPEPFPANDSGVCVDSAPPQAVKATHGANRVPVAYNGTRSANAGVSVASAIFANAVGGAGVRLRAGGLDRRAHPRSRFDGATTRAAG